MRRWEGWSRAGEPLEDALSELPWKPACEQCASVAARLLLSAREDLGENQVEITVIPSRCNTGHPRIS